MDIIYYVDPYGTEVVSEFRRRAVPDALNTVRLINPVVLITDVVDNQLATRFMPYRRYAANLTVAPNSVEELEPTDQLIELYRKFHAPKAEAINEG